MLLIYFLIIRKSILISPFNFENKRIVLIHIYFKNFREFVQIIRLKINLHMLIKDLYDIQ
jgi:hypothetical protein